MEIEKNGYKLKWIDSTNQWYLNVKSEQNSEQNRENAEAVIDLIKSYLLVTKQRRS